MVAGLRSSHDEDAMPRKVDLTGQKFGRLTVTGYAGQNPHGRSLWQCQCSCGGISPSVQGNHLTSGATKSCGCLRLEVMRSLDGMRFGRLVVVGRGDNNKHGKTMWHCRCDCEKKVVVVGSHLWSGHAKSCGCLNDELRKQHGFRHGHASDDA